MHPSCPGWDNEACVFRQDLVKICLVASRLSLVIGIILLVLKSNNVCINIPMQELWSMAVIPYQLSWSLSLSSLSSASSSFLVLEVLIVFHDLAPWPDCQSLSPFARHQQSLDAYLQPRLQQLIIKYFTFMTCSTTLSNLWFCLISHQWQRLNHGPASKRCDHRESKWGFPLSASENHSTPEHLQTHSKSLMTHHISYIMTSWEYEQQKGFEEFKPRCFQCILEIFHLRTKRRWFTANICQAGLVDGITTPGKSAVWLCGWPQQSLPTSPVRPQVWLLFVNHPVCSTRISSY